MSGDAGSDAPTTTADADAADAMITGVEAGAGTLDGPAAEEAAGGGASATRFAADGDVDVDVDVDLPRSDHTKPLAASAAITIAAAITLAHHGATACRAGSVRTAAGLPAASACRRSRSRSTWLMRLIGTAA